ncbi:protein SET-like [Drosophila kikkawai]|uniref:Protein SET-like n=1 Tax=Drosophila kikkawai TaxID=30033 RepID=A0A6P4J9P5_DROKI|nr:protein SET-like [Drosophila kikkawai]
MSDVPKKPDLGGIAVEDDDDNLLERLTACQKEADKIHLEICDEMLQVESKYNKLRKPYYEKRSDFIKKVPNFWMTAIMNHPKVACILDEDEEDCLHSLSKLVVEESEDIKNGFRIIFHFNENAYFEDQVLTKEFFWESNSTSTPIKWKEGKNLLQQVLAKPYDRERRSEYKSFFDWFSHDADYVSDKIALILRDEIWPSPVKYYKLKDIGQEPMDAGDEGK